MGCTQSTEEHNNSVPSRNSHRGSRSSKGSRKPRRHNLANNMIIEFHNENVKDSYTILKQIGEGSISNIYLVQRKLDSIGTMSSVTVSAALQENAATHLSAPESSSPQYALKEIDMKLVKEGFLDEMRNEIKLMKTMDHPNILKAYEVYDQKAHNGQQHEKISIIMEYCSGGDLSIRSPCSEDRAKMLVAKITEAVNYLHLHGIMHRDLKFENIMLENDSENAEPKLIDFGLAQKYGKQSDKFHDKVGTVYTMSPEAIRGDYDKQTDMWSIGVVSYMLLAGKAPFWADTRKEIAKKVVQGKFSMEGPKWKNISKEAKDFIRQCLQIEPKLRYTAEQALKSPWLSEITTQNSSALRRKSTIVLLNQMSSHNSDEENRIENSEFRRLVLQTIAYKASSQEDILKLREVFHSLDANHDGQLTLDELRKGLKKVDMGDEDAAKAIEAWFQKADMDAGGDISYTEFIAALLETQGELTQDKVREAFQSLDRDHSGYVTRENLKDTLGVSMQSEYVEQLLHEADLNGDGKISFEEFNAVVNRRTSITKSDVKKEQEKRVSAGLAALVEDDEKEDD